MLHENESEKDFLDKSNLLLLAEIEKNRQKEVLDKIKRVFCAYLDGKRINLFEDLKGLEVVIPYINTFTTKFSRRVIEWVILNLTYGKTASYSDIGKKINSKAYQAIGNIMRNNPFPLVIPCHRVVRKNGQVGGFMGKVKDSWQIELKKSLLEMENRAIQKNKT
ncbi:MAG: putative Methylated-DNA--[protein]-cysteine S-methyltransferase [Promethearchaeota archaeon]|jgi:O-6-methylguanine DNA methyltransferase|nr:MAG: putative Methylated-DNA--[protein]-cysteine S-methyltransferase [Candidatus Lokiarchaeota archaeon]